MTEQATTIEHGQVLVTKRVLEVCEAIGDFIEYWGFKAVQGRIWTLLALHRRPLSQVEVAELLGISRSLVSMSMSVLADYGLVNSTSEHRNAPYSANIDVWPIISNILRKREWMLVEQARVALEAALDEIDLESSRGHEGPWSIERLRLLLRMTEMAQGLLKVLISLRLPRSLDTALSWVNKARKFFEMVR